MSNNYQPYQFDPPAIATGSNRVNSSKTPPATKKFRASIRYSNILAAGTTLNIPCDGTQFYFRVATGEVQAKPSGGAFSPYGQGQGMQLDDENAFNLIQVRNDNAFAIVFELFVGFQGFIDNQLIIAFDTQRIVARPTYATASSLAKVTINDISSQAFTDINGNQWYALARESLNIFNPDTGVTLLVQKVSSTTSSDLAIAAVYPMTSLRLPYSGDYCLNLGGAMVNAIVSEGYYAIPKVIT